MTEQATNSAAEQLRNEVVVTLEGRDITIPMYSLEVNMDSSSAEILGAVQGIIREEQGVDLADERGDVAFAVRKALNSNTIYVYPKPVAG